MDQPFLSPPIFQLSPASMDPSISSTNYPTDSEGATEGLLSVDESLRELLEKVAELPESSSAGQTARDSESFDFSFPPLKRGIADSSRRDLDRPTAAEKEKLIEVLRKRKVNNVVELRRIEKSLAAIGTIDVTEPMTSAWLHYVDSNAMITELRGLTKNYPFSSECVDEAKRRVISDPKSNRSWNVCWLILHKIHSDNLIPRFAHSQAADPQMWGNTVPTAEDINMLAGAFIKEWKIALLQMLRHWHRAPCRR